MLNQILRYEPVVSLVEELEGTRLLEAGSGSRGIAGLLSPQWDVTSVDVDFSDYGERRAAAGPAGRVVGDVRDLPFADKAFDAVVALDLIEHLPAADRQVALGELARVAARRVVVGCPCGNAALSADRRLLGLYERNGQEPPPWLVEHVDNGFPEGDDLRRGLAPYGRVRVIPNESVSSHERLAKLEARPRLALLSAATGRVLGLALRGRSTRRAAARVVERLRGRDRSPSYRSIAVLDVGN
jgi:hypothetical protein